MPAWMTSPEVIQGLLLSIVGAILWAGIKAIASWTVAALSWTTARISRTTQAPKIERLSRRLDYIRSLHQSPSVFIANALQGFMGLLMLLLLLVIGQATVDRFWRDESVIVGNATLTPMYILQIAIGSALLLQVWSLRQFIGPVAQFDRFERRQEERIQSLKKKMIAAPEVRADIKQVVSETKTEPTGEIVSTPPTADSITTKRDAIARRWYRGRVIRWGPRFGFIERDNGESYYFDPSSLVGKEAPAEGSNVLFWGGGNTGKKHESAIAVLLDGQIVEGVVADVPAGAGYSIVLVTDQRGNFNHVLLPFAHPSNYGAKSLKVGSAVEFKVDHNKKGALAIEARDLEGSTQPSQLRLVG